LTARREHDDACRSKGSTAFDLGGRLTDVQAVGATQFTGSAILAGGAVKAWGGGVWGGIGEGSTINRQTPVTVPWQASVVEFGLSENTSYVIKRAKRIIIPPVNPSPPPVS
jgi:hypothetical protein